MIMFALPWLYVASYGPWFKLMGMRGAGVWFYRPLILAVQYSDTFEFVMNTYMKLWMSPGTGIAWVQIK